MDVKCYIYFISAQNNGMIYEKIYVKIVCEFLQKGGIKPLYLFWLDGKRYDIEKLKSVARAPCKSGGVLPERYTVIMCGKQKYLYYEQEKRRWFVEREIDENYSS